LRALFVDANDTLAAVTDKLPYDWMRDLAPVSIVTRFAPVMI